MNKELLPGRIRGTVFDETTQRPIVAANIIVVGTSCGATSDMAREYLIDGLLAGTYNIRIMMMGYETRLLNNVVVNPDRITWQKNEIIVRGSITVEF